MDRGIEELLARIRAVRHENVTATIEPRIGPVPANAKEAASEIEAFLRRLEFALPNDVDAWWRLDKPAAREYLASVVCYHRAYEDEVVELATAKQLADGFLSAFSGGAVHFTNAETAERNGHLSTHHWMRITNATFDEGLVAMDEARIGILWVEDED
ncbi:MAG: hypothetical protein V3T86_01645 [Planctomycetota bacterium]